MIGNRVAQPPTNTAERQINGVPPESPLIPVTGTGTCTQHVSESRPTNGLSRSSPSKPRVAFWERRLLEWLLRLLGNPEVAVELYDGTRLSAANEPCRFLIRIGDRVALWKLLADPMFQFAELYTEGRVRIEGDLTELLCVIFSAMSRQPRRQGYWHRFWHWLTTPVNTLSRSRANAAHHYDLGNDFYRLWLDERLVYTCAYFPHSGMTIEEAQLAKMDHICRKLRLAPGHRVLELGCGWGAMAIYMAQKYGAVVRACNVSHEQVTYARQLAQRLGLAGRVEFLEDDWRNMQGTYDRVVSVGMLEHVGPPRYPLLGKVIQRCLASGGLALIHTIGRNYPAPVNSWIKRRIFPGGYAPSLKQIMTVFEPCNFSVLDVENIRLHYAETLRHWSERFENVVAEVVAKFGERFARMWKFYLSCSQAAFRTGGLQLFQVLFAHGTNHQIPWTRDDIYAKSVSDSK